MRHFFNKMFLFAGLILLAIPIHAANTPPPQKTPTELINQFIQQSTAAAAQGHYDQAIAASIQAEREAAEALKALPTNLNNAQQQKQQAELNFWLAMAYQQQGQVLWKQALVLQLQSDYAQAEPLLKKSVELGQNSLPLIQSNAPLLGTDFTGDVSGAPLQVIPPMLALAASYQVQGRHNEASTLLEQCHNLLDTVPWKLHANAWATWLELARLYRVQGATAQAETLYQAIINGSPPPDEQGMAETLLQLGQLYQSQQKYPQAEQCYRQSIQHTPKSNANLTALASLYMEQGDYPKAEPLLQTALDNLEQPASQPTSSLEQTLRPIIKAATLNMQARNDTYLGKYTEAASNFQRNLTNDSHWLLPANPGSKASSLSGLAKVRGLEKNIPAALALIQQAAAEYAAHLATDSEYTSGKQQLACLHLWLLQRGLAWQQIPADTALPQAFTALQQAHGAGRTEALRQTALQLTATDPTTRDKLQRLWQQQTRLQQLDKQYSEMLSTPATAATTSLATLKQAIQEISQSIQQQQDELTATFPVYTQLLNPEPLSLAEVQALLQPDEALITWVLGESSSNDMAWLFVVRPGHAPTLYLLDTNKTTLQAALTDPNAGLLSALSDPKQPFNLNTAHTLYQQLLAPAEADLTGVKHILAVPDGVLQNLPLHLLLKTPAKASSPGQHGDYAHADWLARHYAFSYLPSVHALADLRHNSTSKAAPSADPLPFIGFGDAVLAGTHPDIANLFQQLGDNLQRGHDGLDFFATPAALLANLERLPDTAHELITIAKTLKADPNTAVWLAQNATESKLKQLSQDGTLRRSRIISFATHALLPADNPQTPLIARLEPGLVLTPPTQGSTSDDGYLSASEIAGLELNADWVLLSACNTGTLTKQDSATGLSALSKAFFTAGAHSVLASHWSVNSQATAQLMTQLFAKLDKNPEMRRSEALRQTMLAMLETPTDCGLRCWLGWQDKPPSAHPAYWAAFVIYGEGGNLQ